MPLHDLLAKPRGSRMNAAPVPNSKFVLIRAIRVKPLPFFRISNFGIRVNFSGQFGLGAGFVVN
jgi:hypothetical protein